MDVGLWLLVASALGGCPSASGPKPPPDTSPEAGVGSTAERAATLRVTDHWARCTPGEARPLALHVAGEGASPRRLPLEPGRLVSVPVPVDAGLAWEIRDAAEGTRVEEGLAGASGADIEHGCSPHALRARPLAALVLASDASREVTVEVAGLAVTVASGTRQVLHLPRGTHSVVRDKDDACEGTRIAVELHGAGALVRLADCEVAAPLPL